MFDMSSAVNVHSTQNDVLGLGGVFADIDYGEISAVPERRIWMACIIEFIRDYENTAAQIARLRPEPNLANQKLRWELERELIRSRKYLKTEDFHDVCEYAEFSSARVKQKIKEINQRYNLGAIPWLNLQSQ